MPTPRIDSERLCALLKRLNGFGHDPSSGGHNRLSYGGADMSARRWLSQHLQRAGLSARIDAVGNVIARYGPTNGPALLLGSHLDTVPDGGAYDGVLGVCAGVECVLALRDAGAVPCHAIEVIATAEEEGRFGGMLGAQAIADAVDPDWFAAAADADGQSLPDALRSAGLNPERIGEASRPPGDLLGFIELHIEQGPVLEAAGKQIGIVDTISGVCLLEVTLTGRANHAGTTPMSLRADAFAGLARAVAGFDDLIARDGTEASRITVGRVEVRPGFAHTIAGEAICTVVVRDDDLSVMARLVAGVRQRFEAAAKVAGLAAAIENRSWLEPVPLDDQLHKLLLDEATRLGLPVMTMASGAGHDTQILQTVCPCGLIFVPSRGGISHSPDEYTCWEDAIAGVHLMLAAVTRLVGPLRYGDRPFQV